MATDNDKKKPEVLRFHVLTPNGDLEFFEAEADTLFIVRRSSWSGELVFSLANADDAERLLGEQGPYYVRESDGSFYIAREGEKGILSVYFKGFHPHARAAAKAERDRLNEEWRKEQNNG